MYILGGMGKDGLPLDSVEHYDFISDRWEEVGSLAEPGAVAVTAVPREWEQIFDNSSTKIMLTV